MSEFADPHPSDIQEILARARNGDPSGLGMILAQERDRLKRMVALRLDRRLRGRVDPSDVVQEAQAEAVRRFPEYLEKPDMPLFLWLRLITGQRILITHRQHLNVHMRSAKRELSLERACMPQATSAALAAQLLGNFTSPSVAAMRAEVKVMLHAALESMDPNDRDVLTLRHFEQLTSAETAEELGISVEAAKKRHIRALKKLKEIMGTIEKEFGGRSI